MNRRQALTILAQSTAAAGALGLNHSAQAADQPNSSKKRPITIAGYDYDRVAALAKGKVNDMVNSEPRPSRDFTVRSPFIMRDSLRAIAKLSPAPPYLRVMVASACRKGLNKRDCTASLMP